MRADRTGLSVSLAQPGPIPLDVQLASAPGELLALVGPSGSGKTTVLRSIAGLYRPQVGRILADGEVWLDTIAGIDLSPQARRVGLVFQDYALFPHLSALDNVRLALLERAEPERTRRAAELLARMHLEGLEARRPDELSGGQSQRVAIARGLARDPRVLLLDEPFSAVDRITRETLKDELAALHRALDIPMVLVTHDLEEAQALADRICVLDGGATLQIGAPDDVRLRPRSARVARLMGQHNLLTGVIDQDHRIRCGELLLAAEGSERFRVGDSVTVLLPPDGIALAREASRSTNLVKGSLADLQRAGEFVALTLSLPQGALRFTIPRREAAARQLRIGDACEVEIDPSSVHAMRD